MWQSLSTVGISEPEEVGVLGQVRHLPDRSAQQEEPRWGVAISPFLGPWHPIPVSRRVPVLALPPLPLLILCLCVQSTSLKVGVAVRVWVHRRHSFHRVLKVPKTSESLTLVLDTGFQYIWSTAVGLYLDGWMESWGVLKLSSQGLDLFLTCHDPS